MATHEELQESFIEKVKEALEKLYDFQALQENELTKEFDAHQSKSGSTGTHQLRSQLIDAIESLNPGQNVAAHSGTVRIYNLIYMHYVGRLTIQQVAYEIGVSLRQAYRDLRRGQELVSAVLWDKLHRDTPITNPEMSVSAELTRLEDNPISIVLRDLLETALRPVQILADKYAIALHVEAPQNAITITTNPIMGQQIITHILSQIIQQVKPSILNIQLAEGATFIHIQYDDSSHLKLHIEPIIQQMIQQVHWEFEYSAKNGIQTIGIQSSKRRALVLVIDDNEGLIHLLQRYLTDDAYTVMSVPNSEQGLQLIPQLQPDAIILDVMMPGIDGWELLQRLRTRRETTLIPVIICSVINDPELAFALGASQYISKPVTRESLRLALQQLHV